LKPIRVMMLIQSYSTASYGGAERQIEALTPLLQERGIELHVLTRNFPSGTRTENLGSVKIYRTPYSRLGALRALFYIIFGLIHIARVRPQVLHAHGLFSTTTTAMLARRLFRIPVVAKILRGGVLGDLIRVKNKRGGASRVKDMRQNVDTFIVISEEIRNELLAEGISPEQIRYIPNGVDSERFMPLSSEAKLKKRASMNIANVPTVVYAGRLVAEKRVNHLITSWKTIQQTFPDARLFIVGQGEERQTLEAMGGDGIQFMGAVNNVPDWLQVADIFVLPSIAEGLSNSLLEAMSSGLAVIATGVGDAPNLVQTHENGWCIPPDDVNALTDALLDALGNLERTHQMGTRSRERILKDFQLSATAEKLRQLYENVV
jgi:glycosyltransferase involved in cell wall biosynthesis